MDKDSSAFFVLGKGLDHRTAGNTVGIKVLISKKFHPIGAHLKQNPYICAS